MTSRPKPLEILSPLVPSSKVKLFTHYEYADIMFAYFTIGKTLISPELGNFLLTQRENKSLDRIHENLKAFVLDQVEGVSNAFPKLGWMTDDLLRTMKDALPIRGPETSLRKIQHSTRDRLGAATILEAVAYSVGFWGSGSNDSLYIGETTAAEEAFTL